MAKNCTDCRRRDLREPSFRLLADCRPTGENNPEIVVGVLLFAVCRPIHRVAILRVTRFRVAFPKLDRSSWIVPTVYGLFFLFLIRILTFIDYSISIRENINKRDGKYVSVRRHRARIHF